jgi:hypothetical protein
LNDDNIAIHYAISGLRAGVLYSHYIRDPPKNLQELYYLFEKYARSEELHQIKIELSESLRRLHSPAEHLLGLRNRIQPDKTASSHKCIILQISSRLETTPLFITTTLRSKAATAMQPEAEEEARVSNNEDSIAFFVIPKSWRNTIILETKCLSDFVYFH